MSGAVWSRARVAQVDSDDRVVLLRLDGIVADTAPIALDGVALAIWDLLAEPRAAAELQSGLASIWPDRRLTEQELAGFLGDLVAAGVAVVSPPSAATA